MNFALWKHHGMTPDVSEGLIPFEVDLYVGMIKEWIDKQAEMARKMGYKTA